MTTHFSAMEPEPLRRLYDNYTECLNLDQAYLAELGSNDALDLDRLESFILARTELLAEAEPNLKALGDLDAAGAEAEDPARQALMRRLAEVLEEVTGLEGRLSDFLGERLREVGETISQLRRVQPVFQRYSQPGGDKTEPSLITRHE